MASPPRPQGALPGPPRPRDYSWGGGWYGLGASKKAVSREDDRLTADIAWSVVSYLLAGIGLYGALGWLVGTWLGQPAPFAAGGVLVGTATATYLVNARITAAGRRSATPGDRS